MPTELTNQQPPEGTTPITPTTPFGGAGSASSANKGAGDNNQQAAGETFEAWLEKADPTVKTLYEQHTAGLRNTVKATRDERDALTKQVKDLLGKSEKGSQAEKDLTAALAKMETAEKRATFAEDAVRPEIGCSNPKLAYILAVDGDLFDRKGNPDWAAIKTAAPELFRKANIPNGDAGNGTNQPNGKADMNQVLRGALGRR